MAVFLMLVGSALMGWGFQSWAIGLGFFCGLMGLGLAINGELDARVPDREYWLEISRNTQR